MDSALLPAVLALVPLSALGAIQLRERRRPGQHQRLELRFGRDVTPEAVIAVLDRIAGLHRFACVALEVQADHDGIHHFISSDQATINSAETGLRAHLPNVELCKAELLAPKGRLVGGAVRLRGRLGTLRSEAPNELSSALLAAFQPLGQNERIVLRWLLRPGRPMTVLPARSGTVVEPEERRRLRIKNAGSVLLAHGSLAVEAGHPRRTAHLLAG